MKWYHPILTIYFFFLAACGDSTSKELPKPNVYEVKNIGVLSTTEYTIGKIVQMDDPPKVWYKTGDRKLLISCKAKVKAGVDLSKVKEGDIKVSGNTIKIKLPPAKITTFTMDANQVHTEMESVSGLRDNFTQAEKNSFMRQGEEAIRRDLKDTRILKDAEESTEAFLKDFYKQMGFKKVIIEYGEEAENE